MVRVAHWHRIEMSIGRRYLISLIDRVNTPALYNWIERLQELTVMKKTEVPCTSSVADKTGII
ncbi:hypothetical protein YC2023_017025 [Brassica napus]